MKLSHALTPTDRLQAGVTAIEYGILAALVAVVGIAGVTAVGETLSSTYGDFAQAISGGAFSGDPEPTPTPTVTPPPAADYTGVLPSGMSLAAGFKLTSTNGAFETVMETGGAATTYRISDGAQVWSTNTTAASPHLDMQPDGNLALYDGAGGNYGTTEPSAVLWQTETGNHPGAYLQLDDSGNLNVMDGSAAVWTGAAVLPDPIVSVLGSGEDLAAGQKLTSPGGQYRLSIDETGFMSEYRMSDGAIVWTPNFYGSGLILSMQTDGNLVARTNGTQVWATQTFFRNGATLNLADDGSLTVVQNGTVLWKAPMLANAQPAAILKPDGSLTPGASLVSPNGAYQLSIGPDGYASETRVADGSIVWSPNTFGTNAHLDMQGDGNLVAYVNAGRSGQIWATDSYGNTGSYLALGDDGTLKVIGNGQVKWQATWAAPQPATLMKPGTSLAAGESILSPNGVWKLRMQADGNLTLTNTSTGATKWASGTNSAGSRLDMQSDGNLVIYRAGGGAVWSTWTSGNVKVLYLFNDGGLRIGSRVDFGWSV